MPTATGLMRLWDKMVYLANWPKTDPSNFAHLFLSSLPNAMIDIERKVRHNAKTINMTSLESQEFTRSFTVDYVKPIRKNYSADIEETDDIKKAVIDALEPLAVRDLRLYVALLNGTKYTEIATAENMPLGTVKSRLHKVHKQLESSLPALQIFEPEVNKLSLPAKEDLAHKILSAVQQLIARKERDGGMGIAG
jgi:DNA-directed RNA polymerase specialized sigma24 family protein